MSDTPKNDPKQIAIDMAYVNKAIELLISHYDSVQIFCTKVSEDGQNTTHVHRGKGDWYARYGLVKAWVKTEENDFTFEMPDPLDDIIPPNL